VLQNRLLSILHFDRHGFPPRLGPPHPPTGQSPSHRPCITFTQQQQQQQQLHAMVRVIGFLSEEEQTQEKRLAIGMNIRICPDAHEIIIGYKRGDGPPLRYFDKHPPPKPLTILRTCHVQGRILKLLRKKKKIEVDLVSGLADCWIV
jgi:hypothetical protein